MCHPTYYTLSYEINHWMNIQNQPVLNKSIKQWYGLHHLIIRCGGYVVYLHPKADLPDMVFTANAGFPYQGKFIVSNFKHPQRKPEEKEFIEFFAENGFDIIHLDVPFEGMGDALVLGKYLVCGHGFRTHEDAHPVLAKITGLEVISLKLTDPRFYHLDTCFCPINSELAIIYQPAIESFPKGITRLIELNEEEAVHFGCNSVVLGDNIIVPEGCPKLCGKLKAEGLNVYTTPMDQFILAGGACKCLTLPF